MVKGISRQVIVVQSPEPELFEQAIFILRDGQKEVTDEALLKEAKQLMRNHNNYKQSHFSTGMLYAGGGALLTGLIWLATALI